jgi:hypothetical protein
MPASTRIETAPTRFATKHRLDKKSGCWLWTGAVSTNRYGQFHDGERCVGAHHYSWRLHRGPITQGMYVCHKCDVPTCVNPEHLFLDTPSGNQRDMVKKGRGRAGRPEWRHPPELKRKIQNDPRPYRAIAAELGLSFNTIKSIKSAEGRGHRARRIGNARSEIARLTAALQRIADMVPATRDVTIAHEMGAVAVEALLNPDAKFS